MYSWLKRNWSIVIAVIVTIAFIIYMFGCEPKTKSLLNAPRLVNRQELQLELDQIIGLAQLRMVDLDQQEQFRAIILENALILVQGQPFNPIGLITAAAAVYGLMAGGSKVTSAVKNVKNKRKVNNGTT